MTRGRRGARAYLLDMAEHARLASDFVGAMTVEAFAADLKTRHAVTNVLAIIGEAAGKLPKDFRDAHPDVPWTKIVAMRNVLAHDYLGIRPDVVFDTVAESIPQLLGQLETLLAAVPEED